MCGSGFTPSVTAVAEANSLSVGFSISNNLFDATIERLALLLQCTETKSDCCQRDRRDDSGWDLDDAVGEHCIFLATTVLLLAARFFAGDLVGHGLVVCLRTLWRRDVLCRHISEGITDQKGLDPWLLIPLPSPPTLDWSLLVFVLQLCPSWLLLFSRYGDVLPEQCYFTLLLLDQCEPSTCGNHSWSKWMTRRRFQ